MGYNNIIHLLELLCALNGLIHVELLENSSYDVVSILNCIIFG